MLMSRTELIGQITATRNRIIRDPNINHKNCSIMKEVVRSNYPFCEPMSLKQVSYQRLDQKTVQSKKENQSTITKIMLG